ncbi:hypothetical protein EDD11_006792 [Mortierella claussenii]|nr:hypothetical protein EDD11_006792 [Mortierella claussenii]
MYHLPRSIVKKYATHIRILDTSNDWVLEQNFMLPPLCPNDSLSDFSFSACTRLVEYRKPSIDRIGRRLIQQNTGLQRLAIDSNVIYEDDGLFDHLRNLRHLEVVGRIRLDKKRFRRILKPIASTLVTLSSEHSYLIDHDETVQEEGDEALEFPCLQELHLSRIAYKCFVHVIGKGPAIEFLGSPLPAVKVVGVMISRLEEKGASIAPHDYDCVTRVTTGNGCISRYQDTVLAPVLKDHPGLQQLELYFADMKCYALKELNRHVSTTLRSLKLFKHNWRRPQEFVIEYLKAAAHLESLDLGNLVEISVEWVLTKENWTHPDSLQTLTLRCEKIQIYDIPLTPSTARLPAGVSTSTLADHFYDGWKVQGGLLEHNLKFLELFFELARDFQQLRTITINNVVYRKKT